MDELGKWFLGVITSINGSGRLGPPAASSKCVKAFLEQIGGGGVLKLATMLNIGNTEMFRSLAVKQPDMGDWLAAKEIQNELDSYFAERNSYFEPRRKFFTRGLGLSAGNTEISFTSPDESETNGNDAWEKVFQIIAGRNSDDKESSDL